MIPVLARWPWDAAVSQGVVWGLVVALTVSVMSVAIAVLKLPVRSVWVLFTIGCRLHRRR